MKLSPSDPLERTSNNLPSASPEKVRSGPRLELELIEPRAQYDIMLRQLVGHPFGCRANGIRVQHEPWECRWARAYHMPRWKVTFRAPERIRTCRGSRR